MVNLRSEVNLHVDSVSEEMSVKVLKRWLQVLVPHPSYSTRQRCHISNGGCGGGPLLVCCRFPPKCDRRLTSRSCRSTLPISNDFLNRTATAILFSFSDDEFPEEIEGDDDDNGSESRSDEEFSDKDDVGDAEFDPLNLNHHVNLPDGDHDCNNAAESRSDAEPSEKKDGGDPLKINHHVNLPDGDDYSNNAAESRSDEECSEKKDGGNAEFDQLKLHHHVDLPDRDYNGNNAAESRSDEESSDKKDFSDEELDWLRLNLHVKFHHDGDHDSNNADEESSNEIDYDPRSILPKFNVGEIFPKFEALLQEHEERMRQLKQEASEWRSIIEDAAWEKSGEELMNRETRKRFISPFKHYLRQEAMYLSLISKYPHNRLFLTNYAQFLYQVARDNDRAEMYFVRALLALGNDPIYDAETFRKYGEFLWKVRKNWESANRSLFTAFCLEPHNTYLAEFYDLFRWITSLPDSDPSDDFI